MLFLLGDKDSTAEFDESETKKPCMSVVGSNNAVYWFLIELGL